MTYTPPMILKPTLGLIVIILEIGAIQNTTNTTDLTANVTTAKTAPLALDITTILPDANESLSLPVGNTTEQKSLQDLPSSSEKLPVASHTEPTEIKVPSDCFHREKIRKQLQPPYLSKLRKCCPYGETLITDDDSTQYCETLVEEFTPDDVTSVLYENCIDALEVPPKLDTEVGNPCNVSFIFSPSIGDRLAVLPGGSLLIIFANESYEIEITYCLDTDIENGEIFVVICVSSIEGYVGTGQSIYTWCRAISFVCNCTVSILIFAIKDLRSVHLLSLGVMSACLAIGFFLHTIAQISEYYKSVLGYFVQFFMLYYYFWLCFLCFNVVLHVWYYLPKKILITDQTRYAFFIIFALISFLITFLLVILTNRKDLPGMPSYFFQRHTKSIRESQLIQIVEIVLGLFSFFGFRKLIRLTSQGAMYQQVPRTTIPLTTVDQVLYQEIKKDAKCTCRLFTIIVITRILEDIRFMEILNCLQGVFILMVFIVERSRRNAIVRWWHERGSHEVTNV